MAVVREKLKGWAMPDKPNLPQPTPGDGQILIYQDGTTRLQVRLEGQTVWLSQRLIAELFQVSVKTANEHLVNAHGAGVAALRAAGAGGVGIALNLEPKDAASDSAADRSAARRADAYMNGFFLDAIAGGAYPAILPELFGKDWPEFPAEDFRLIAQPLDWLGVNYYTRSVVRDDPDGDWLGTATVRQRDALYTETGWEVHPPGLAAVLDRVWRALRPVPLYITENGAAFPDPAQPAGGRLDDPLRVEYLRTHLLEAQRALDRGVDLRGYFAWSLLDNVEWAEGLSKRFGLVHVDHASQRRTVKASGRFYAETIRAGGIAPKS